MKIIEKNIEGLKEYDNNPRINDDAVQYVANSIKEFGFKVPVVIDKDNVIVAGHTRVKACRRLGIDKVPCIVADDLTPEQIKAYRLADNKVHELATWDLDKLNQELEQLDELMEMSHYGFMETSDITSVMEAVECGLIGELTSSDENKEFAITLNFPSEKKEVIYAYIKERGKSAMTDMIIKGVEDA